jgi:hypothetical protein
MLILASTLVLDVNVEEERISGFGIEKKACWAFGNGRSYFSQIHDIQGQIYYHSLGFSS